MTKNSCAVCGSDDIREHTALESVRYKGSVLRVPMAWSECNSCAREFVATEQIRANDAAVVAVKRESDGLLTPSAVRQVRRVLDLSQEAAARLFGGGRNAFSKYERGEVAQSVAMDRLIRLCLNHPELLEELSALAEGKRHIVKRSLLFEMNSDWYSDRKAGNDEKFRAGNQGSQSVFHDDSQYAVTHGS